MDHATLSSKIDRKPSYDLYVRIPEKEDIYDNHLIISLKYRHEDDRISAMISFINCYLVDMNHLNCVSTKCYQYF